MSEGTFSVAAALMWLVEENVTNPLYHSFVPKIEPYVNYCFGVKQYVAKNICSCEQGWMSQYRGGGFFTIEV